MCPPINTRTNKLLMEIKTTYEISRMEDLQYAIGIKWVKVDDVLKYLDEGFRVENDLVTIKPPILLKFYNELKGDD